MPDETDTSTAIMLQDLKPGVFNECLTEICCPQLRPTIYFISVVFQFQTIGECFLFLAEISKEAADRKSIGLKDISPQGMKRLFVFRRLSVRVYDATGI